MSIITIGSIVKVDHPQTVLNPDEYFRVEYMEYEPSLGKTRIRGENTCWFNVNMILDVKEK